jgi:hypothetical protein
MVVVVVVLVVVVLVVVDVSVVRLQISAQDIAGVVIADDGADVDALVGVVEESDAGALVTRLSFDITAKFSTILSVAALKPA